MGSDKRYETNKVPFLSSLPWIGKKFFTSTSEVERTTDLIIQITPRIIKDHYSGIIKSDLHKDIEKNSPIELNEEKKEYFDPESGLKESK